MNDPPPPLLWCVSAIHAVVIEPVHVFTQECTCRLRDLTRPCLHFFQSNHEFGHSSSSCWEAVATQRWVNNHKKTHKHLPDTSNFITAPLNNTFVWPTVPVPVSQCCTSGDSSGELQNSSDADNKLGCTEDIPFCLRIPCLSRHICE